MLFQTSPDHWAIYLQNFDKENLNKLIFNIEIAN